MSRDIGLGGEHIPTAESGHPGLSLGSILIVEKLTQMYPELEGMIKTDEDLNEVIELTRPPEERKNAA